jgi:hypothetical protein
MNSGRSERRKRYNKHLVGVFRLWLRARRV